VTERFKLTGNAQIDADHDEIFKLYDEYVVLVQEGNYEEIKRVFYELLEYLTFHFIREEELMTLISYPDISDHRQHHFQMQEIYLSLVQPVLSGKETNAEVQKFMELLKSHIEKQDSKISEFIEERNK
jgi:hemerythrin